MSFDQNDAILTFARLLSLVATPAFRGINQREPWIRISTTD